MKSLQHARYLSVTATIICIFCMIPPILIGGVAKSVDWTNSSFSQASLANSTQIDPSLVLPASMTELVPYWIGIIALAAVRYFINFAFKTSMALGG